MYDSSLVEPGPLPPHERTWRHPSELGPTKLDVDDGHGSQLTALIVGALAVVSVAAMVVAMSPRPTSGPMAISATTTPITQRATLTAPGSASPEGPTEATGITARPSAARAASTVLLTTFAAMPHSVSAGPQLDLDGTDIAAAHPAGGDAVFVRTGDVTYRLDWAQVPMLGAPDGSVVFDERGDLVAHVSGGKLISLIGD